MRTSTEAYRRLALVASVVTLASILSACGKNTTSAANKSSDAVWTLPIATSTITPRGVWAAVAMGHLRDPLNTFWQLPFRPAGKTTWTNQVEATATATNGGLILASAGGTLLVGIRPSVDLTFSPLISTDNGGLKWSSGLLDTALIPAAGSLAVEANKTAGAVTASAVTAGASGDSKVESDEGNLSSWRTVGDLRSLNLSAAGRACDPRALTAVGYSGENLVVGAACTDAGSNGMFTVGADGWRGTGPALSASAGSAVTVLAAASQGSGQPAATQEAFLLGLTGPAGERPRLVVVSSPDGTDWKVSSAIAISSTRAVVSFGPAPGGELFVLARDSAGSIVPYVTSGPGAQWVRLPDAPPGTATLAEGHAGTLEALAVNDTVLTFSTFDPRAGNWGTSQIMPVKIEFGSSNP